MKKCILKNEAKKVVVEQGTNPPSQADKTLQTKEEKAQQVSFDKEVQKFSREKKGLGHDLRVFSQ